MAATVKTYDEFEHGLSWVLDEPLERTSHALLADGRVWLVDPVDVPEAIDRATALGEPAAVLQLLDRHNRDCAAVAERLGVLLVKVPDTVPGSPFGAVRLLRVPGWQESALWWPAQKLLVVAEAVGTAFAYTAGQAAAGVHIFLRLTPPSAIHGYTPQHLLVGHGAGIHGPEAATALDGALARSRSDIPAVLKGLAGQLLKR